MGTAIEGEFFLTTRGLSAEEAERLSRAIRETPNILGYLPRELLRIPECLVAEASDGGFAGVCIVKKLPAGWADMAVLFVFPEYRRRGLGAALFWAALNGLRERGANILCISREPSVLRLMEASGMRYIAEWRLPLRVQFARMRHYQSAYRFREALRKSVVFPDQPSFRYAVLTP